MLLGKKTTYGESGSFFCFVLRILFFPCNFNKFLFATGTWGKKEEETTQVVENKEKKRKEFFEKKFVLLLFC